VYNELGFKKTAVVGFTLNKIFPIDLNKDLTPEQLKRHIRKHPKHKLPETKMDLEISQNVKNLRAQVPNPVFEYATHGASSIYSVKAPSSHGTTASHEWKHSVDRLTKGEDYFGVRGTFGFGGKPLTELKSERSANVAATAPLSKPTQRARGGKAARSYDSYDFPARENPGGDFFPMDQPRDVIKANKVYDKVQKGFKEDVKQPDHKWYNESPRRLDLKGAKPSDRVSSSNQLFSRNRANIRTRENIDKLNKDNITKTIKKRNVDRAFNRKVLVRNLSKLGPEDQGTVKQEVMRYIKNSGKQFGPSVGRAAIQDVRSIRDEVRAYKPPVVTPTVVPKKPTVLDSAKSAFKLLRKIK